MNKTLVMGIGNPHLSDDRIGIEVVEALEKKKVKADFEIVFTVGFEVMDKVLGYDHVFIVDACLLGREPGTILEVELEDIFTNSDLTHSHAITLGATLKTGYQLFEDEMPDKLEILLIQAQDVTTFSDFCTPKVQGAINTIVNMIDSKIH